MSPQMEHFFALLLVAEAAHKAGLIAQFDILMAEIYDVVEDLPREEREWLERNAIQFR